VLHPWALMHKLSLTQRGSAKSSRCSSRGRCRRIWRRQCNRDRQRSRNDRARQQASLFRPAQRLIQPPRRKSDLRLFRLAVVTRFKISYRERRQQKRARQHHPRSLKQALHRESPIPRTLTVVSVPRQRQHHPRSLKQAPRRESPIPRTLTVVSVPLQRQHHPRSLKQALHRESPIPRTLTVASVPLQRQHHPNRTKPLRHRSDLRLFRPAAATRFRISYSRQKRYRLAER